MHRPIIGLLVLGMTGCAAFRGHPPPGINYERVPISTTKMVGIGLKVGDEFHIESTGGPVIIGPGMRSRIRYAWRVSELKGSQRSFDSECWAGPDDGPMASDAHPSFLCGAQNANGQRSDGLWLHLSSDCSSGEIGFGAQALTIHAVSSGLSQLPFTFVATREDRVLAAFRPMGGIFQDIWPSPDLTQEDRLTLTFATSALWWLSDGSQATAICRFPKPTDEEDD